MKCTRVEKFLPLYIADDLKGRRRTRAVEKHLMVCEGCRRSAAEYQASRELFGGDALAPDFDGKFYEEIRNSVLARIGRERTLAPPRRFSRLFDARLAYAASLALLLIFAALALQIYTRRTSIGDAPQKMIANANHVRPTTPATIATQATTATPQAASPQSDERPTPHPANESAHAATGRERRASKSLTARPGVNIERARNEAQPASPSARLMPSHAVGNPTAQANVEETAAAAVAARASGDASAAQAEVSRIEIQTADPNIRIIWLSPTTEDAARPLK